MGFYPLPPPYPSAPLSLAPGSPRSLRLPPLVRRPPSPFLAGRRDGSHGSSSGGVGHAGMAQDARAGLSLAPASSPSTWGAGTPAGAPRDSSGGGGDPAAPLLLRWRSSLASRPRRTSRRCRSRRWWGGASLWPWRGLDVTPDFPKTTKCISYVRQDQVYTHMIDVMSEISLNSNKNVQELNHYIISLLH
jgi:hypothetical protein